MKNISKLKYILSIDRGNTKTSYALHELENPISKIISIDEAFLIQDHSLVIASNVSSEADCGLPVDIDVKNFFKNQAFLTMPVHYASSLGADRLCLGYIV